MPAIGWRPWATWPTRPPPGPPCLVAQPEHPRHWDTGDSAAGPYGAVVPMVECRNLAQLSDFVRSLA
jgi:hypothetical protein